MRIYRGNVGIEMSLDEFTEIVASDELLDDTLNLLEILEMEQIMQYNEEDMEQFERELLNEIEERKRMVEDSSEAAMMRRVLEHLKYYE